MYACIKYNVLMYVCSDRSYNCVIFCVLAQGTPQLEWGSQDVNIYLETNSAVLWLYSLYKKFLSVSHILGTNSVFPCVLNIKYCSALRKYAVYCRFSAMMSVPHPGQYTWAVVRYINWPRGVLGHLRYLHSSAVQIYLRFGTFLIVHTILVYFW